MMREERAAECASPDAVKISAAHNTNGSQYRNNPRQPDMRQGKPRAAPLRNRKPIAAGAEPLFLRGPLIGRQPVSGRRSKKRCAARFPRPK
jgi:hypothetical protein